MQFIGKQATTPTPSIIIRRMRTHSGFTLIELMVILAVLAIVIGFGVPQLSGILQSNRIVDSLNNLSAHLTYARTEAVRRSACVGVVPFDASNWALGWQVYVDSDCDGVYDAGEPQLRQVKNLNLPNVSITPGSQDFVLYSSLGTSILGDTTAAANTFTLTYPGQNNRTLKVATTGHVSIP